jgi:hypothetical protein
MSAMGDMLSRSTGGDIVYKKVRGVVKAKPSENYNTI